MFKTKSDDLLLGYNLQLFADDGNSGVNDDDNNNNDDSQSNDQTNNNDSGNGDNKPDEKMFSQDQVNKMMTREKKQGRNSVLKELGINPNDSKALEKIKSLIASQKTDEQIASEKEMAMQEAINEAENRAMMAEFKTETMMAGVKPQYVDDAVTLAVAKIANSEDETTLKNVLIEFKTKYPIWFSGDDDSNNQTGQNGTGAVIKGSNNTGKNENGLGAKLAAQRKANNNNKKSYWTN